MPPTEPKLKAIHWDGTVTAGNVLTAAAMLVAMLSWGLRLEGRVDHQDQRTNQQDARLAKMEEDRASERTESGRARERLATIEAKQSAQLDLMQRVERQIERIAGATTGGR